MIVKRGIKVKYNKQLLQEFLNGEIIKHGGAYYKFDDKLDTTLRFDTNFKGSDWEVNSFLLESLQQFDRDLYREVEPQWYDEIPDKGILCKVSDDSHFETYIIALVIEHNNYIDDYKFKIQRIIGTGKTSLYKYAKPLTKDEILEYII